MIYIHAGKVERSSFVSPRWVEIHNENIRCTTLTWNQVKTKCWQTKEVKRGIIVLQHDSLCLISPNSRCVSVDWLCHPTNFRVDSWVLCGCCVGNEIRGSRLWLVDGWSCCCFSCCPPQINVLFHFFHPYSIHALTSIDYELPKHPKWRHCGHFLSLWQSREWERNPAHTTVSPCLHGSPRGTWIIIWLTRTYQQVIWFIVNFYSSKDNCRQSLSVVNLVTHCLRESIILSRTSQRI